MDNKKLGAILLIFSVLLAAAVLVMKSREDAVMNALIEQQNSCYLPDGTCLHENRNLTWYIIGWVISALIAALGFYLVLFEKSEKAIVSALKDRERKDDSEHRFSILLKALDPEEQRVIRAVKEQDGITQQTLRLRTDLHKSKLSIILDRLERRNLIARKEKGKTKQVFLKFNV